MRVFLEEISPARVDIIQSAESLNGTKRQSRVEFVLYLIT